MTKIRVMAETLRIFCNCRVSELLQLSAVSPDRRRIVAGECRVSRAAVNFLP